MKRYRIARFDFDSRPNLLGMEIKDEWQEEVKNLHIENKARTEKGFIDEFGVLDWDSKKRNIIDIDSSPLSIIAFHNNFFYQVRRSFIIGSYYPALTAACALGERILNHLILLLRDDFKNTKEYKEIYRQESFDDWDKVIRILSSWEVLLPEVATNFLALKEIRNREAIHFNAITEDKDREISLRAIKLLAEIIKGQFVGYGLQPWFIEKTKGSFYIKKSWEDRPFIKKVYIPNCVLVGPYHKVMPGFVIIDDYPYEDKEISDEEFSELLAKGHS